MIKIAFSDKYLYQLPEGHRFPISKYELLKDQLLYEGTISEDQLFDPGLCAEEAIVQVHSKKYFNDLLNQNLSLKEVRRIGLPINSVSVNRARNTSAGTLEASVNALKVGIGLNIGGGTHHAYETHGEGFCILNDIAIAAKFLLDHNLASKILIVDLDVHQGNGTAVIFAEDQRVFTFSMHGQDNYPLKKEKSDLDIPLANKTGDELYLKLLKENLNKVIDSFYPDIVFYQAGVDVLEADMLGKLALTKSGCQKRDELLIEACYLKQIPLVVTMGGGYSARVSDIVDAHANTFRKTLEIFG
ncbi:histone deacetylase [soil metagenome]